MESPGSNSSQTKKGDAGKSDPNKSLDIEEYAAGLLRRAEARRKKFLPNSNSEPRQLRSSHTAEEEPKEDEAVGKEIVGISEESVEQPSENIKQTVSNPNESLGIALGRRRTLSRLGQLHATDGTDMDELVSGYESPVHKHSQLEKTPEDTPKAAPSQLASGRKARLGTLASTINDWEDDTRHVTSPSSRFYMSTPKSSPEKRMTTRSQTQSGGKTTKLEVTIHMTQRPPVNGKSEEESPKVLSSVQDHTLKDSVDGVKTTKRIDHNLADPKTVQIPPPPASPTKKTPVYQTPTTSKIRTTMVKETKTPLQGGEVNKTPIVSEMIKLFEQQGNVGSRQLVTPSKFARSTRTTPIPDAANSGKGKSENVEQRKRVFSPSFEKLVKYTSGHLNDSVGEEEVKDKPSSARKRTNQISPQMKEGSFIPTPPKVVKKNIQAIPLKTNQDHSTKQSVSPSRSPRSASPKANYPGACDVRRIKVNSPKPGKMYPSLTDMETSETDADFEDEDSVKNFENDEAMDSSNSFMSNLGDDIQKASELGKVVPPQPNTSTTRKVSDDINTTLACKQIDELIGDALEGQDYTLLDTSDLCALSTSTPKTESERADTSVGSTMEGMDVSKTCLNFESPQNVEKDSIPQNPQNEDGDDAEKDSSPDSTRKPLVHTVSMYRMQESQRCQPSSSTVSAAVPHPPPVSHPPELNRFDKNKEGRIRWLNAEIEKEQAQIAQTCKALSLCRSHIEFTDSLENVDGERILIIATQKKTAYLNEKSRLEAENPNACQIWRSAKHPNSEGNLQFRDISIPIICDFAKDGQDVVYNFICFLKYRDQVCVSELKSVSFTSADTKMIQFATGGNHMDLVRLHPNFEAKVEIYMLKTRREFIPHDAKYHIKRNGQAQTPKKMSGFGRKHPPQAKVQPIVGSSKVFLTSNFNLVGVVRIDITNIHVTEWIIDSKAPLDEVMAMNISGTAELHGELSTFLTLLDDIGGSGCWKRMWCKLTVKELQFWAYPEDEDTKPPLTIINLHECCTSYVEAISRDICMRANTLLLTCVRPKQQGDTKSSIRYCNSKQTVTRYMLSADMMEEREIWIYHLNWALKNLRAWDITAQRADNTLFKSR